MSTPERTHWAAKTDAEHPQSAQIIIGLGLPQRPGLRVTMMSPRKGIYMILETVPGQEDAGDAITGVAVLGEDGTWYLGCQSCGGGITEDDAGMCQPCRQDAAWHDQSERDAWTEDGE